MGWLEDQINAQKEADAGPNGSGKAKFDLTGDNTQYYDENQVRDSIINSIEDQVLGWMKTAGKNAGMGDGFMEGVFYNYWTPDGAFRVIQDILDKSKRRAPSFVPDEMRSANPEMVMGPEYYRTPAGLNEITQRVWEFYNGVMPFDMGPLLQAPRRGSSGSGRPSAEDIRNQFDVDQLAQNATDLWRGYLLEEPDDARGIARDYVNAIVATGGQQKIDFGTYVQKRAKETSRWASVYRSKPENVSEIDYIGRYHQAALQVMRPQNADSVAIGGAQLGADSAAFAARLGRTDEVQRSSSFIDGLGTRMNEVSKVLRG